MCPKIERQIWLITAGSWEDGSFCIEFAKLTLLWLRHIMVQFRIKVVLYYSFIIR
jgi:hypothetical protein